MTTNQEQVKALKDTAGIGLAYALQLIEWFGSAEAAIDYLCAESAEQARMLDRALVRTP